MRRNTNTEEENAIGATIATLGVLAVFASVSLISVAAATTILVEGTKSLCRITKGLLTKESSL